MKYRKLGATGLEVSEIGFGTWGLGGNSYGPVDDAVAMDALRCAFDAGLTFYDTSDLYGNGHSEELLGTSLRNVRNKIVICTKVGLLPHTGFEMPSDFSPRHIRAGLEASLKRLQTDYVDLYLLHSPTLEILRQDERITATLRELKSSGKIRFYGISARSPDEALAATREFDFSAVQVNFNLIDQRAIDNGFLAYAAEKQIGVIARTPLCFGYLTGKLTGKITFKGIDHRSNWPADQLKRWAAAPDLFAFLNNGNDRTPAQLALRFCLDHPSVSTVIPGMMHRREVTEDAAAVDIHPLERDELERIKLIYKNHTFFDKKAKQGN